MTPDIDIRSKELLDKVTTGLDFSIPNVDFDDKRLQIPEGLTEALQNPPEKLTLDTLTTREIDGDGAFDYVMTVLRKHLEREYECGRITGAEYTKAYIAMTQYGLQFSVQYLLGKDLAHYQALGAMTQALSGNIEAYGAKVRLAIAQAQAHTNKAQYATQVLQLAGVEANTDNTKQQELNLKQQEKLLREQTEQAHAQISDTRLDDKTPISGYTGNQNSILKQQELNLKQQEKLLKEQTEQAHAQVSDMQLDGTTPVTGYTGNQNSLLKQQVTSFKKDAIIKAAKIYSDSLTTQLSMNTATVSGTGLDSTSIGSAMSKLASSMDSK